MKHTPKTAVVIPNWNGQESIAECLESLLAQTLVPEIVVVDNNSTDISVKIIEKRFPTVKLIKNSENLGFAGGVNTGIRYAIANNCKYVGLLNNDAVADKNWLKELAGVLGSDGSAGIAACKLLNQAGTHFDSTGENYSIWGLHFPRGRGEKASNKYDQDTYVFAASGGASLYRSEMLKEIGLFDEDFFAYYEDVDLSFRAQLAGWNIHYSPKAVAYHQIGATSKKLKGFVTYQAMKNLPLVVIKNVPIGLSFRMLPRFLFAYCLFFFSAARRGHLLYAIKGFLSAVLLTPKKIIQRHKIQKNRKVSARHILQLMYYDLPPNATNLRTLRSKWRKLTGRHG